MDAVTPRGDVQSAPPAPLEPELASGLAEAFEHGPAMVAVLQGPGLVLVHQNRAMTAVFGPRRLDVPLAAAYPELQDELLEFFAGVYRSGDPAQVHDQRVRVRPDSGLDVWVDYTCTPLRDPASGTVTGLALVAVDVSARIRAVAARRRMELLARVTSAVIGELDPDVALHRLAETLVPDVADLAAVYVADEAEVDRISAAWHAGQLDVVPAAVARRVALAVAPYVHVPTPTADSAPELDTKHPRDPMVRALLTGETVSITVDEQLLTDLVEDPVGLAWLRAAGGHSLLAVPLAIGGRVAGVVTMMGTGDRPAYTADDTDLLTDVAARAAVAIGNAYAYRRQRWTALALQRTLLPSEPPTIEGLEVAARYVAASTTTAVGGDWWDVYDLGAGRVGFGIGDVAGRGPRAAAVMGQLRAAMRTAAYGDLPPADALALLDEQLADLPDEEPTREPIRFATAAYATYEPRDRRVDLASAGHLPPLVIDPGGTARWIGREYEGHGEAGVPLGLRQVDVAEHTTTLPAGATIALFSDGLVEDRRLDLDVGLDRLEQVLVKHLADGDSLDEVADRTLADLGRGTGHDDDVALLLLRPTAVGEPVAAASADIAGPADVGGARRTARAVLERADALDLADTTELVVSELVGNALRHASPPVRLDLHVTPTRVVVEVTDPGGRLPRRRQARDTDEDGRGLQLVAALSQRWGSRLVPSGKATWAELARR